MPQFKAGVKTDFYLVSRKDCRRPGRRFITRGLDYDGFAANYVETEHIVVKWNEQGSMQVASFVQVRGSIPSMWSMKPNLKWEPPIIVSPNRELSTLAAEMHFRQTKKFIGP